MPPPEDNGVSYLKIPIDTLAIITTRIGGATISQGCESRSMFDRWDSSKGHRGA